MIEVEVKYRLEDAAAFEQELLRSAGAVLVSEVQQCDQYFDHPCRDFEVTDEALRLRTVRIVGQSEVIQICYKGPRIDTITKTREELECDLLTHTESANPSVMHRILRAVGFVESGIVRKDRRSFECRPNGVTLTISVDRLDRIGAFAEIEIVCAEQDRPSATDAVLQFAASLGLVESERRSYLELLAE